MKKEKPVSKTRAFPIKYGYAGHFYLMHGFGMGAK